MNTKIFLSVTTTLLLLTSVVSGQMVFMDNPMIGHKLPDFTLETVKTESTNFSEFRGDNDAIVFFWATWCPHCRVQLKNLNEQKDKLKSANIRVVLIDVDETKEQVGEYLNRHQIDYDVFLDKGSKLSEEYGLMGVPTFFFINKEGIVKAVKHSLPEDFSLMFQ